jgi:hypothetical protein
MQACMCTVLIVIAKKTIISDISYIIIGSSTGTKIGTYESLLVRL